MPLTWLEVSYHFFYQVFFPDFNHFQKWVLRILSFSKTTKKRWKLWCHKTIDLFIEVCWQVYSFSCLDKHLDDTSANFNPFRNRPSLRQLLIIVVSSLVYTLSLLLKIFAGMSPFLVAFLEDRFINSFLTSIHWPKEKWRFVYDWS